MLTLFAHVCLPLVVVVGAGWFMDRRFTLHLQSLVKLNLYLMVPAFVFVHLLDTPMAGGEAGKIVATAFTTILLSGVVSFAVGRVLKLGAASQKAHALACMLGNCGNFGLPLVTLAFGPEAAAVQVYVLVTMNVSTFTVGLFLANSDASGGWRSHLRALSATLRQPAIYAVASALTCKSLDLHPESVTWLWEPLQMLSNALIGFALVTLGVQLSQTQPAPLRAPLISAIAVRLLVAPCLAFGLTQLLHFPKAIAAVIILTAGAPTAVNSALLAHEFGGDRAFATASVYYSTVFSMITITLSLALLRAWMGQG